MRQLPDRSVTVVSTLQDLGRADGARSPARRRPAAAPYPPADCHGGAVAARPGEDVDLDLGGVPQIVRRRAVAQLFADVLALAAVTQRLHPGPEGRELAAGVAVRILLPGGIQPVDLLAQLGVDGETVVHCLSPPPSDSFSPHSRSMSSYGT